MPCLPGWDFKGGGAGSQNQDESGRNRGRLFSNALEKTENQHFSNPHVQYIFDGNESQYRWVISLSRAVELTEGTSTAQGVLLVDLSYSSLAHLFEGVTTGTGGYVYLISSDGEILYHPKIQLIDSGRVSENNLTAAGYKDGNHLEKFEGRERIITVKSVATRAGRS